jgi:hypothetical protein
MRAKALSGWPRGTAEIQRDHVLNVGVHGQRLRIGRSLRLDAKQTMAQRLELALDHIPIHAALLHASTLAR